MAIFLSALRRAYRSSTERDFPSAPAVPGPASFGEWAKRLQTLADSGEIRDALPFWIEMCKPPSVSTAGAPGDSGNFQSTGRRELNSTEHRSKSIKFGNVP